MNERLKDTEKRDKCDEQLRDKGNRLRAWGGTQNGQDKILEDTMAHRKSQAAQLQTVPRYTAMKSQKTKNKEEGNRIKEKTKAHHHRGTRDFPITTMKSRRPWKIFKREENNKSKSINPVNLQK